MGTMTRRSKDLSIKTRRSTDLGTKTRRIKDLEALVYCSTVLVRENFECGYGEK